MDQRVDRLMRNMEAGAASDLHIAEGLPPQYRVHGELQPVDGEPLSGEATEAMIGSLLSDEQRRTLEADRELDTSLGIPEVGRFRINVFFQRDMMSAAIRKLPYRIPEFADLGFKSSIMESLCQRTQGMILATGATGSGKSTTLASMIDYVNQNYPRHIISVEDPIEYVHHHKRAMIQQREVGRDTHGFAASLKYALRQDPDVVQIGEMRDVDTISAMLTIAETGHLAFSTLHTNSAVATINRIIDVFPPQQQEQVRVQLSFTLEAVITQRLLPRRDGGGRVLAYELMLVTPPIRNLIRENQVDQIYSYLQMGRERGMQTFNDALARLLLQRKISEATARSFSSDEKELDQMLK